MKAFIIFLLQWFKFKTISKSGCERFALDWKDRYPCLDDCESATSFDRHYVYHPAWAARILAGNKPDVHYDISSTLSFCSIVSAFIAVRFYDYRPPALVLDNLDCSHVDLLALPFADNSISSLSCMHVLEHIGLGRYGDPLDPDGDIKAIEELKRVLMPGGTLLIAVPVSRVPRIRFNAHRIYSYSQLSGYFPGYQLKEFCLIPDRPEDGGLIRNAAIEVTEAQAYGCGCFHFVK